MSRATSPVNRGPMTSAALLADRTPDAVVLPKHTHGQLKADSVDDVRGNHTRGEAPLPKCTQPDPAHELAAVLFDEALTEAGIETSEVAYLLGISESLVRRMRSKDARERVSFMQLLKLTPAFHFELHRALNRHYGFGRQLLVRLLDDLGAIAVGMGVR